MSDKIIVIDGMTQVTLTNNSIKKILKDHQLVDSKIENPIAEYVWNGFDAGGTKIEITYVLAGSEYAHTPRFKALTIKDNGSGIDFYKLNTEFTPFYDSEKASISIEDRHHSNLHGKNGIGRLSFSAFAHRAIWNTTFNHNGKRLKYSIEINDTNIGNYDPTPEDELIETNNPPGTTVELADFATLKCYTSGYKPLEETIIEHLRRAFGWKLELNAPNNFQILLNGKPLDYLDNIDLKDETTIVHPETGTIFRIKCVLWNCPHVDEFSRYYYLGSDGRERYKETTGFNNKGDNFYHSVFIQSDYFDDFDFEGIFSTKSRNDAEFKFLLKELSQYLREKRKPVLRKVSSQIISKYEKEGYIVKKNKTPLQLIEIADLERVIKEMFIAEPRIFSDLSPPQIKTMIGFLQLVLNSEEREQVLEIINRVVTLNSEERKTFCEILKITELNKIIQTIDMVIQRYGVLKILREIVFKLEYQANERDHLQQVVAFNYWIFGEQYNLVSEDEDFETALKNYLYILRGVKKDVWMKDPNKCDRMDIFLCRQDRRANSVHNIIVELKHPTKIGLGETEYSQVMKYMNIIVNEPQFAGLTHTWDFYLIGSKYNKSGYVETLLENKKSQGLAGLALDVQKYRIFVKLWNDVITECELRHDFLNEKLKLKKDKIIKSFTDADEAVRLAEEASLKIIGWR